MKEEKEDEEREEEDEEDEKEDAEDDKEGENDCEDGEEWIVSISKNKPGRAYRCVCNESVYNHNVFSLFLAIFGGFAEMPTDLWTCGHTHGQTVRNGSI